MVALYVGADRELNICRANAATMWENLPQSARDELEDEAAMQMQLDEERAAQPTPDRF